MPFLAAFLAFMLLRFIAIVVVCFVVPSYVVVVVLQRFMVAWNLAH